MRIRFVSDYSNESPLPVGFEAHWIEEGAEIDTPNQLAQAGRSTCLVKIQCDAAKICVVLPNVRARPSVKGAIQINAIIWFDFYWCFDLVTSVKRA